MVIRQSENSTPRISSNYGKKVLSTKTHTFNLTFFRKMKKETLKNTQQLRIQKNLFKDFIGFFTILQLQY